MASWRVAPAVKALFTQANLQAPNRSKAHDGTIGDTAHSRRRSDHNPDASGWVYAGDLTDDDASGIDCREIARQIVARRDRRVKYLIHEGRICSGAAGPQPWVWRNYNGPNGHFKHLHVSVTEKWRGDTSPWWAPPPATPTEQDEDEMTPADWQKLTAMLDDRLRIILRAENSKGEATGHDNLRDLARRLDRIEKALGSGQ